MVYFHYNHLKCFIFKNTIYVKNIGFPQNYIVQKRTLCQKVKDETLSTTHFPKLQFTFHAGKLCANNDVTCGKIYILQKKRAARYTSSP